MPAQISPSPSVNFKTIMTLRVGFLSFFKGALFPISRKIIEREFLIMGVSNSMTSSASYLKIFALDIMYCVWQQTR